VSNGPSDEPELSLFLWVIVLLVAALEVTWWLFERMYAS
jgi:hypothetical protein